MNRTLSEQELRRREELAALREAGIEPYPFSWEVQNTTHEIVSGFDDEKHAPDEEAGRYWRVKIAGRLPLGQPGSSPPDVFAAGTNRRRPRAGVVMGLIFSA